MNFSTEQQLNQLINNYNKKNEIDNESESSMIMEEEIDELEMFERRLEREKKRPFAVVDENIRGASNTPPAKEEETKQKVVKLNMETLRNQETSESSKNQKPEVTIFKPTKEIKNQIKLEQSMKVFAKKQEALLQQIGDFESKGSGDQDPEMIRHKIDLLGKWNNKSNLKMSPCQRTKQNGHKSGICLKRIRVSGQRS